MRRIDLQEFLRRLNDDLWAIGRKKQLEDIVIHLVHPRINYIPRQLIRKRYSGDVYQYFNPENPLNTASWGVAEDYWDVVKVSRRRYATGLKLSILVHRARGA